MWIPLLIELLLYVFATEDNVSGPLTPHFQQFLSSHGNRFKFALDAIEKYGATGSYGGMKSEDDHAKHTPIVFIHGNSDSALDMGETQYTEGWSSQISHFQNRGYKSSELYAISYGDRNITNSFNMKLTCEIVEGHRRFVEAVLEYTKKRKVIIFGHSMGVTIARIIIQGGEVKLDGEVCNLGPSLRSKTDTLLAIASANYGMCICAPLSVSSCSPEYGYFPGVCKGNFAPNEVQNACSSSHSCNEFATPMSKLLSALNNNYLKDADHVFSLWSTGDNILGKGNNSVWGKQTSIVPFTDKVYKFKMLDHFELKSETVKQQFYIIRRRKDHSKF